MSNLSNPQNIFKLYLRVFIGYIIGFLVLAFLLNLIVGCMSGGSINMIAPLLSPKNWLGLLVIVGLSSCFSTLEVKRLGLGWFVYGIFLFIRVYYLFRAPDEWLFFPGLVRAWWNIIVVLHPIVYLLFGGKIVERVCMTEDQREEAQLRDEIFAEISREAQFEHYRSEYYNLNSYTKIKLSTYGIHDDSSYAQHKMRDRF